MSDMRVTVDRDRCVGSATCVGIAPDLFELEDGRSRPLRKVVSDSDDLRDAVESCPVEAIMIDFA